MTSHARSRDGETPGRGFHPEWYRDPCVHLQALLVLSVALGGGGVGYGLRNLAIQLAALLVLAANRAAVAQFVKTAPRALILLVIVSVMLPLVQLVPLPPALWRSLPGREVVVQSLDIAGASSSAWYPVSLDRARTLVAFCGTIAPAALIVVGSGLPIAGKLRLAWTFVLAAMAAFLLGAAQLVSANSSGLLFPITPKPDVLYATFANRNSTGLFFALAALACGFLATTGRRAILPATIGGILLALGTVLTQSRSSMGLLAVVLVFTLIVIAGHLVRTEHAPREASVEPRRWPVVAALAAVLFVGVAAALSLSGGGRIAASAERLSNLATDRPEVWEDGLYAAGVYWPAGSGVGTFDEVFQLHESLEYVSPRRAGRAHQDYIELAIEAGPAGLFIAAGWIGWIAWASLAAFPTRRRWIALGAGTGLAMIAMQSLVDYPLRCQTLLCVGALLVVFLARNRDATE